MHSYYGYTDCNALGMVTYTPWENCSFSEQGMADNNMDFKYELSFP
jgi:hypothetical protein